MNERNLSPSTEALNVRLGQRIRQAKRASDLTQERLAELIQCSPTFVSAIECGRSTMRLCTLVSLSNALGIRPDLLLQDSLQTALP